MTRITDDHAGGPALALRLAVRPDSESESGSANFGTWRWEAWANFKLERRGVGTRPDRHSTVRARAVIMRLSTPGGRRPPRARITLAYVRHHSIQRISLLTSALRSYRGGQERVCPCTTNSFAPGRPSGPAVLWLGLLLTGRPGRLQQKPHNGRSTKAKHRYHWTNCWSRRPPPSVNQEVIIWRLFDK
jgi:hypothetical protein